MHGVTADPIHDGATKTTRTRHRSAPETLPPPNRCTIRPMTETRPPVETAPEELQHWIDLETEHRLIEEDPYAEAELESIRNFPPKAGWFRPLHRTPGKRPPNEPCIAIETVIHSSCNGWTKKPTALEAEHIMKARQRGEWADVVAWMIATESPLELIVAAEQDGAYSLQDLAWWIKNLKIPAYKRIRWLNAMARSWSAEQTTSSKETP